MFAREKDRNEIEEGCRLLKPELHRMLLYGKAYSGMQSGKKRKRLVE